MNKKIKELVQYSIESNLCKEEDFYYVVNQLLEMFNHSEYEDVEVEIDINNQTQYINALVDEAVKLGLILDDISSRDRFESRMMDVFLPKPSDVTKTFIELYTSDSSEATDYLYNLAIRSNYIKVDRVSKNIKWKSPSNYGDIDMTINVSKPEKTVEEIKRASMENSVYPKCMLCPENIGFSGNAAKPSRHNLRAVPLNVNDEEFYLQYSPYVYYNEHSIVFKKQHDSMVINDETIKRLLDFVEQFPSYFLGSNADLPIVGGSILSHEHYQGGKYEFPIERAGTLYEEEIGNTSVKRLNWPLTVLRVIGSKNDVFNMACKIISVWRNYSDEEADIISKTDKQHNTVTPIARMNGDMFEVDLALRNNRTSKKYPEGIFHSHPEHHHIKRENLGLIEVMGLSVLPARLVNELEDVKKHLNGEEVDLGLHSEWAKTLIKTDNLDEYLKDRVSEKFVNCLENAGVYKTSDHTNFLRLMDRIKE